MKLLVNTPQGDQAIIEVLEGGGYFDESLVIWDERVDGELPEIVLGGMVRQGDTLVFDRARMDATEAAIKPQVPSSVSRRQAKQQLLSLGLLDTVEGAIAAMSRSAQIDWADAQTFERSFPLVLQMAALLGWTEAQLDTYFIEAAKL